MVISIANSIKGARYGASAPPPPSYDPDFQAKLTAAGASNIPTIAAYLDAENDLYLNLKNPSRIGLTSGNLYAKTQDGVLHAAPGQTSNYSLYGTKSAAIVGSLVNSPTWVQGSGFQGNGTSSYLTYSAPSGLYTLNSAFVVTIVKTWGTNPNSVGLNGFADSGATNALWFRLVADGRLYMNGSATTASTVSTAARANETIIAMTRTGVSSNAYGEIQDFAGTPITTYVSAGNSSNKAPTGLVQSLARGGASFSNGIVGGHFWGEGLTEQELRDLMTILQTYYIAIGW